MSNFPPTVQVKLNTMNTEQRDLFLSEYNRRKKSVTTGYFCLLFLGWHYAYVHKWGLQILCIVTLWGLLLWWIIDWFRLPAIIKRYNNDLAMKILIEFSAIFINSPKENLFNSEMVQWIEKNPEKTINDYYSKK